MTDVHTVNVTVYGANGAVPQHRRVQVLADSGDDAMAKVFRIVTNNVPYINLDSAHANMVLSQLDDRPLAPVSMTDQSTNPHRTPSYRQA